MRSLLACVLEAKTLPQTLPKRGLHPSNIDAKNAPFLNIDFLRFGLRFGRVLGLRDGAMFAENASHNLPRPVSEPIVDVLETGI